jgi:hypothetical protein
VFFTLIGDTISPLTLVDLPCEKSTVTSPFCGGTHLAGAAGAAAGVLPLAGLACA